MKPSITIIMATFNRAHFIKESLDSILQQSWEDWECIIIDDGSTDNTGEVVKGFIQDDNRFQYYSRIDKYSKGLSGCRNMGLDICLSDFIVFFDDDDIVHPENLKICRGILDQGEIKFCRYEKKPFVGPGKSLQPSPDDCFTTTEFKVKDLEKMITGTIPFASCCVMWDVKCFENHRFNEDLMYAEEWECYSRILADGFEGVSIDKVLYYNRKHSLSNTGEYKRKDPIRLNSQILAAKLVLDHLHRKKLFNQRLEKFFLRMGVELGSREILKIALHCSEAGFWKSMKYNWGVRFYPILKPIFTFKSKLKK